MVGEADVKHGSTGGYQAHVRLDEDPCDLCRGARREYSRLYRLHGPMFSNTTTRARITEYMDYDGPRTMNQIVHSVEGATSTIRRTVYRMRLDGTILYDTYTQRYTGL